MNQQLVALKIINKALNIPQHTTLSSTLVQIHELTVFRKTHQLCNNTIFTLRDQLAKLNLQITAQTNQYLNSRLALAKLQSQQLFKVEGQITKLADIKTKTYPKYESFQQFMNDEFQVSTSKCTAKQTKLQLAHNLSFCYIPMAEIINQNEQKWQSRQLASKQQQELSMVDSV